MMFDIFFIKSGEICNISTQYRNDLCTVLMILQESKGVKAVKVFQRGSSGWVQIQDLYKDLNLGFKDWPQFRPKDFLQEDYSLF